MDMQKLVDAMSEMGRMERGNYHVTLGAAIGFTSTLPDEMDVIFSGGNSPSSPDSYRGYYSDLSFEPQSEAVSVKDFSMMLNESLGKTFNGYKGGDFTMTEDTPLWMANYGECGEAIISINVSNGALVLTTKDLDD